MVFIRESDKSRPYHPLFGVVEALDELNCCALSSSAWAHEGCGLPRLYRHTQLVQNLQGLQGLHSVTLLRSGPLFHRMMTIGAHLDFGSGGVVEGHVVKLNVPFDPVKLVPGVRKTIDLGLLRVKGVTVSKTACL